MRVSWQPPRGRTASPKRTCLANGEMQGESTWSLNFEDVPGSLVKPGKKVSFVERRIRRIVNARSVTIGLAVTFVGLALIGGVIIRFVDQENFPSVGLGIWWALQTVTTVGYGDVVPSTFAGRTIGGLVAGGGGGVIAV